jgi:hypothetical protein
MHRRCCPSCAHGMSLPTGSTPAHTREQSKWRTTHPADAACALWSPHAIVLAPTTQPTTARDKGLARGTCSQNEKGLETTEDRRRGPLPPAPGQPQRTLADACHPRRSSYEACACAHHGVCMALPGHPQPRHIVLNSTGWLGRSSASNRSGMTGYAATGQSSAASA